MIKFRSTSPNGLIYGFGLSRKNIDKLIEGKPIKVDMRDMGGPNINVVIMFGETESAIYDELKEVGLLPPGIEYREPELGEVTVQRVNLENNSKGVGVDE